jgi:hypothetical protein
VNQSAPLLGLLAGAALLCATPAAAQTVRGTVRSIETSLPIPGVQILLRDSLGVVIGSTVSTDEGFFILRASVQRPFSVQARRLGLQMADTELLRFTAADTLELEFRLAQVALEVDAVEVTGMAALNEERLQEAYRKGWQVLSPELIAMHRDRARDLESLLRSVGTQSISWPRNGRDCVRNTRTNRCYAFVVDGQVLGQEAMILPNDIYFVAVLTPSESRSVYGSRAMDGAIAIFTRNYGDRGMRPPPPPRPPRRRP